MQNDLQESSFRDHLQSWNKFVFAIFRYKLNVHLESKVNDRKQRYIRVSLPRSQEDLQQSERERQNAELVS